MGLMCCAYGDALLNHQLLHLGMLLFATGHVCYITAFGWKPVELWIGQILYTFGGAGKNPLFCLHFLLLQLD